MARTKKYPGTLTKRGQTWRLSLYINGKRSDVTLGAMSKPEAIEAAWREYRTREKQSHRTSTAAPMRFHELLDEFESKQLPTLAPNTQATYLCTIGRLREFFVTETKDAAGNVVSCQSERLDKFTRAKMRDFKTWREQSGISPRTLQKDIVTASAIFSYAIEGDEMQENPAHNIKLPKIIEREPVILLPGQYETLLEACASNPMLYLFVLVLAETGVRSGSEALWLRWEHLDMEGGKIHIVSKRDGHRTKSGKSRVVPMSPRLKQALAGHVLKFKNADYNGERSPWVFHHPYARRRAKAGQRLGSLRRAFENAISKAKLPAELHQHDLRHMRVTTWLAKGASPVHVKEAVGHSDLRTTMRYTHLAEEHVAALSSLETQPVNAGAKQA